MAKDKPQGVRPGELVRALNSTPLGEIISDRSLRRHRQSAGAAVTDGKVVYLPQYVAWLYNRFCELDQRAAGRSYEDRKDAARERAARQALAGRDVGPMPEIQNLDRREACRLSLRKFCEEYNPRPFYFGWSADHLDSLARIEEAVLTGALYAWAMPRGSGKTTICRMACLWAVSNAHVRYVYVIGANASKAGDTLDAIKTFVRFLPEYAADFPEIAYPIQQIGGIANRAAGQLSEGRPTQVTWTGDRVALPDVMPPPNWPESWPTRDDGRAPTAGCVIGVSGLTGDGIRGSVHTLTNGEQVRPNFVLLDDPQTDESARSLSQNETRERLIAQAVLGMAAPGEEISAVMPCTVIQPGDMADRLLDRGKHPQWRGARFAMMRSMPTNMAAWEQYFEVYRNCLVKEPPDLTEANQYYVAHRQVLDEGADAAWPDRKKSSEISATQHAMNTLCRDEKAFYSEYQNDPMPDGAYGADMLTSEQIAEKVSACGRGVVPLRCEYVTAFVDIQKTCLYWMACAWADDFTGGVIDYGVWPEQPRPSLALKDVRHTLAREYPGAGLEGQIYRGLSDLTESLTTREWVREDGASLTTSRLMVDANWAKSADGVYLLARERGELVLPSHGRPVGASSVPFADYSKKPGERVGLNWRVTAATGKRAARHVLIDINFWKSFVHSRLSVSIGDVGSLSLFADGNHTHLADQLTAEYAVQTEGRGRRVDEWKIRPDRTDNHLLDCLVGCAVGGSMQGARLAETQATRQTTRQSGQDQWSQFLKR